MCIINEKTWKNVIITKDPPLKAAGAAFNTREPSSAEFEADALARSDDGANPLIEIGDRYDRRNT